MAAPAKRPTGAAPFTSPSFAYAAPEHFPTRTARSMSVNIEPRPKPEDKKKKGTIQKWQIAATLIANAQSRKMAPETIFQMVYATLIRKKAKAVEEEGTAFQLLEPASGSRILDVFSLHLKDIIRRQGVDSGRVFKREWGSEFERYRMRICTEEEIRAMFDEKAPPEGIDEAWETLGWTLHHLHEMCPPDLERRKNLKSAIVFGSMVLKVGDVWKTKWMHCTWLYENKRHTIDESVVERMKNDSSVMLIYDFEDTKEDILKDVARTFARAVNWDRTKLDTLKGFCAEIHLKLYKIESPQFITNLVKALFHCHGYDPSFLSLNIGCSTEPTYGPIFKYYADMHVREIASAPAGALKA